MHLNRKWSASLAAAAVSAGIGGVAHASPYENVHDQWTETWVEVNFCDSGLDVPVSKSVTEHRLNVQRRGPDGLIWFQANFRELLVWTNPETGKTFTLDRRLTDRDAKLEAEPDGTFLYTEALAGPQKTIGPDGETLFVDAGVVKWQLQLDADYQVIAFMGVTLDTGRRDTADRDFCEDFLAFTAT